jgi:hypothetical protein
MCTAITACSEGTSSSAWKTSPNDAGHDQDQVDDRRDRLAVEQQAERRDEHGQEVDHRLRAPKAALPSM